MKTRKGIVLIVFLMVLSGENIFSQIYFKVDKVLDTNYNYFSESSEKYKNYYGKIITLHFSPYSPDAYVRIGTLPQVGPYPYAGPDGNGYNVYAFTDLYGNVMFTNFMGQLFYVAVATDFSVLSYPVSYDNVILECSQTTKAAYDEMVWKEAEQKARIEAALQGYGGGVQTEPVKSGMSAEWYQAQYTKWESMAQSIYNSLTVTGIRTTTENDEKKGYTDWGGSSEAQMKIQLRDAQKQMRDIRNEAMRNGYTITMSTWETATVR